MEAAGRRIVYLDINHWYALGEAMTGCPREARDLDVLRQLLGLVEQGRIMIPLSAVSYIELSENPRDRQREEAAGVMTCHVEYDHIDEEDITKNSSLSRSWVGAPSPLSERSLVLASTLPSRERRGTSG